MDHALSCLIVFLDDQSCQEKDEISGNDVQIDIADVQVRVLSEARWQTCDGFDYVPEIPGSYFHAVSARSHSNKLSARGLRVLTRKEEAKVLAVVRSFVRR